MDSAGVGGMSMRQGIEGGVGWGGVGWALYSMIIWRDVTCHSMVVGLGVIIYSLLV